jgi:hypothetical protein
MRILGAGGQSTQYGLRKELFEHIESFEGDSY